MAYHAVLTMAQRQRLTNVLNTLSDSQVVRYFTLSVADLNFIRAHNGDENQIGIGVQLCFLRYPGRPFEETDRVPDAMLVYIARQIGVRSRALQHYALPRKQTRTDHLLRLENHFGFQPLDDQAQQDLFAWLLPLAIETDDALTLVTSVQDELRKRKVVQPPLERLEELVWHVRHQAHQDLYQRLTAPLQPFHYQALAQLLSIHPGTAQTTLAWLQKPPSQTTPTEFNRWAERLKLIRDIDLPLSTLRQAVPHSRLIEFAHEGAKLTAQRFNKADIPADLLQQYYAWLIAFIVERITILTDQALQMSDELGSRLFRTSEGRHDKQVQNDSKAINLVLHMHGLSGQALIDARASGADPYQAIDAKVGWDTFLNSVQSAHELSQPQTFDYLGELDRFYPSIRRYTPTLLELFDFKGTQATESLRQAIEVIKQRNAQETHQPLPLDAPSDFIKPRWKPYVVTPEGKLNHRYYEFCVLHELRNHLRSGDVWVSNSRHFNDFDEDLIAPTVWANLRQKNALPVAIETNFQIYRQQDGSETTTGRLGKASNAGSERLAGTRITSWDEYRQKQASHEPAGCPWGT